MRRKLMTKKVQIILLIAITVVVMVISAFAVLDEPEYVPYDSNLLRVTDNQDGGVSVQFDSKVTDYECETRENNYTLEAWSLKW